MYLRGHAGKEAPVNELVHVVSLVLLRHFQPRPVPHERHPRVKRVERPQLPYQPQQKTQPAALSADSEQRQDAMHYQVLSPSTVLSTRAQVHPGLLEG
eukprot:8441953-Pyramimonas_sp.AAC.1